VKSAILTLTGTFSTLSGQGFNLTCQRSKNLTALWSQPSWLWQVPAGRCQVRDSAQPVSVRKTWQPAWRQCCEVKQPDTDRNFQYAVRSGFSSTCQRSKNL